MKSVVALFAVFALLLSSCELLELDIKNRDDLNVSAFLSDSLGLDFCAADTMANATIPAPAQAYVDANYPQDSVVVTSVYQLGGDSAYALTLSNEEVLFFDTQGQLLEWIEADDDPGLSQALTDSLLQLYPFLEVEEIELVYTLGTAQIFEVELDNVEDFYLVSSNGAFCVELDESYDDDCEDEECDEDDEDSDDDDDDDDR